ncbi:MAG: 2-dehydropantoate 2-reductase [Chloroflexi bacterium]|nr:2-dehydropantoate 2-reductase [Chloroflexota bacterium]
MTKSMAVLGTGAIGSSVAADLTRAGYDVILIDQWPAHVEAMKAKGLRVTMPEEEFVAPVRAFHLCEMKDLHKAPMRQFDIVFLTCKSYDSTWLAEFIKPFLKPDGVLVSVQNSLNDEWIAPIIGRERDIGCAFEISADAFVPGQVYRNTNRVHGEFVLGELDGQMTPRLEEVAHILSAVAKTQVTTNIWGAKWTKLIFNCMRATTRAALDAKRTEIVENPRVLDFVTKLGKEAAQVATALGIKLEPIPGFTAEDFRGGIRDELFRKFMAVVIGGTGGRSTSMVQQDIAKGRLTEIDYLNGLIVKKGLEVKVPTPANRAMTAVLRQIQEGALSPGLANLAILEEYMSGAKAMA